MKRPFKVVLVVLGLSVLAGLGALVALSFGFAVNENARLLAGFVMLMAGLVTLGSLLALALLGLDRHYREGPEGRLRKPIH